MLVSAFFSCKNATTKEEITYFKNDSTTSSGWLSDDTISALRKESWPTTFTKVVPSFTNPDLRYFNGFRSTFDVVKMDNKPRHNVWLAFTVAHTGRTYWFQTGYGNNYGVIKPFIQVWKVDAINGWQLADSVVGGQVFNEINLTIGKHTPFMVYNVTGTNFWRINIDGKDWVELDLEESFAYNAEIATEESPTPTPDRFPKINFYPAMEVLVNNSWVPIPSAYCTRADVWPLQGNNQLSTLRLNELNMGTGLRPAGGYGDIIWK